MHPRPDLLYTGPAQHIVTAGQDIEYLPVDDLSVDDLSVVCTFIPSCCTRRVLRRRVILLGTV